MIALADHARGEAARTLARAVSEAGLDATIVSPPRLPERPLQLRGFAVPLSHVPLTAAALLAGSYDITHAFSPQDALAARAWRRLTGRPVVFGITEPLTRERLADRRLRLPLLRAAVEQADAVVATTPEVAASVTRWLAVDPAVIAPADGEAHARLWRTLSGAAR